MKKQTYYVTFPKKYRLKDHPRLGYNRDLPYGWITFEAGSYVNAKNIINAFLGKAWDTLSTEQPSLEDYPLGHLGELK